MWIWLGFERCLTLGDNPYEQEEPVCPLCWMRSYGMDFGFFNRDLGRLLLHWTKSDHIPKNKLQNNGKVLENRLLDKV